MKKLFSHLAVCTMIASVVSSCQGPSGAPAGDEGLAAFNKDSLAAHIQVLASDSFQGRRPFTVGETRTVDYLQKEFTSLGLEPGNGNSYLQDVPLVEISPVGIPTDRKSVV